jgi:hypothetical protein
VESFERGEQGGSNGVKFVAAAAVAGWQWLKNKRKKITIKKIKKSSQVPNWEIVKMQFQGYAQKK